jgi:hypothetical protein
MTRGHYTKRQKSYDKASLRKPIAIANLIAIPLCNAKYGDFNLDGGSCANGPLRNVPKGCLIATACVLR